MLAGACGHLAGLGGHRVDPNVDSRFVVDDLDGPAPGGDSESAVRPQTFARRGKMEP